MNRDDRAHTYGPKNSNLSGSSEENSERNSQPIVEEISLSEAIEDFTLMATVGGYADKTLELYEYVFNRLRGFISEEKLITKIRTKDLREYLASLMDDGLKDTTVSIHFRHLRAFFNWLVDENYLRKSPIANIHEPKTPNKFPKILDKSQIRKLLQAAKNRHGDWSSYRNYTMLVVFTEMGLRLNELVSALIDNLDMKNRSLKVHGKGAKDRKVFFGKKAFQTLRHWLRIRGHKPNRIWDNTVFISQNGEKLKKRNVEQLVTRIQEKAGLGDTKVSPHVLRHTSATLAVEKWVKCLPVEETIWLGTD